MGRAPCCDKANVKRGPWSPEEDAKLKAYIEEFGTGGNWIALPQKIGLRRCGKSCRLRWLNYLRPNIKHGGFSEEEDNIICSLYMSIGSRWSIIAGQLPGRTDNDIKNYWNTKLKKKLLGKHRKDQKARSSTSLLSKRKENVLMTTGEAAINLYGIPQQQMVLPAALPQLESHLQEQPSLTNLLYVEGKFSGHDHHHPHRDDQSIGISFSNPPYSTLYPYDHLITNYPDVQPGKSPFTFSTAAASLNSMRSTCSLEPSNYNYPIPTHHNQYDGVVAGLSIINPYFPLELDPEMNYSADNLEMVNRSTLTSTSPESTTSWGDMTNVSIYLPMDYNHQIFPENTIPQGCIFQESSHFRMQQQTVLQQ